MYIYIYRSSIATLLKFLRGNLKHDPKLNFWILMRDRNKKDFVPNGVLVCHSFETESYQKVENTSTIGEFIVFIHMPKMDTGFNNTLPTWIIFAVFGLDSLFSKFLPQDADTTGAIETSTPAPAPAPAMTTWLGRRV